MKMRIECSYRDTWTEIVEVEVPDDATREQAREIRRRAVERHWPSPPPAGRISPCNLVHESWAVGDDTTADEKGW